MEINRPKQYKQSSRKGKKAWTKNIDLDDIQQGLEENRDNLVEFGVESLNELEKSNLFVIDTKGDESAKSKSAKILKSTEILNKRSKFPQLDHYHAKTKNRISKKDYNYLMAVSGRNKLESASKAAIDKKGFATTKAYDVWSIDDDEDKDKPEILKKFSSSEWTKPKNIPTTLKQAPIRVNESETLPDGGRSYNPSLESWKSLIQREYNSEKQREEVRVELQDNLAKIKNLIKNIDNNVEEDCDDDQEESEESEDEDADLEFRLSINKPVVNKKKTKAQRNKQKRHQERVRLEKELKELKAKITELQKIDQFQNQITQPKKKHATAIEKVQKRKKLGSKHKVDNHNLDIKLSDELTDSLRGLKPEGNLLQDTMFSLQSKGKIETRIPLKAGGRRYKQKITEKWTYKDFK